MSIFKVLSYKQDWTKDLVQDRTQEVKIKCYFVMKS